MEKGKNDSNEIEDNNDHRDQDPSPSSVNEVKLPEIGMTFSSEEEVRIFYNSYAQNVGFGICKLGGRNGDDGKQKYFSVGCAKNGRKVSQAKNILYPRPSTKTNCKAKINVAIRNDGNFVITSLCLEHNHILSPGKSRHFRCNKVLDSAIKRKLELNDQAGITSSKSFQSFVVEAGGYENLTFDERKCRNYISEARRLRAEQLKGVSTFGAKAIHSPLKVRSRGRPPTKRKQSKIEQIVKKSVAKARKEGK
ncbi:hypothetical protein ZIOFF_036494 [Zingiber officinale]|uniref:FAR1 domain-containing protein n=1 Tax=Zingiber officinale TaxID=94328 RepID=A0A8J5GN31_ZINOF|nr:hypothetical protein ZIOFF_036494 [Zingiber officinale]